MLELVRELSASDATYISLSNYTTSNSTRPICTKTLPCTWVQGLIFLVDDFFHLNLISSCAHLPSPFAGGLCVGDISITAGPGLKLFLPLIGPERAAQRLRQAAG